MRLPDRIASYTGFDSVADNDVPRGLILLLGDRRGFDFLFAEP